MPEAEKISPKLLERIFRYNAMDIADPNPDLPLKRVIEVLSGTYPEFTNAKIEPPVMEGNKQVFVVKVVAGDKG